MFKLIDEALRLDAGAEVKRIKKGMQKALQTMRRRGLVVGISGGVDSGVCAALCVEAVGKDRVFGLFRVPVSSLVAKWPKDWVSTMPWKT